MILQYDPYAGMMSFLLIYIILMIVGCIVSIILAVWVYKDAQKREMDATIWLLIVILTGCIIYLIVRKKD